MAEPQLKIAQHDAKTLAAGYTSSFRKIEIFSIIAFWLEVFGISYRVYTHSEGNEWLIVLAFLAGYVVADFISGFVHWMGDTWGSPDMPLVGKSLVRPFREHHVDEKAITRHDYIETNGGNCLIALPWGLMSLCIPLSIAGWERFGLFNMVWLGSMIFWVMMTNQFHKWSHQAPGTSGPIVGWLQKYHFILPPDHHQIHHKAPFSTYYCITTGWLNWPLQQIGFYRVLERMVTSLTGAIPRESDIGIEAALVVAPDPLLPPVEKTVERHA